MDIEGSIDKKHIDKTFFDWLVEWWNSVKIARYYFVTVALLFLGRYTLDFYFVKMYIPALIQRLISMLFAPILALAIIILIVRTVGLLLEIFSPPRKANNIKILQQYILFEIENNKNDTYNFEKISNISLIYNFRGIVMAAGKHKISYMLPLDPEAIEKELDKLTFFKKQVTFTSSKEGYIRTVWYGNPNLETENKSFIATNKNLSAQLFVGSNSDLRKPDIT